MATLLYEVLYGLSFPDATTGAAAKAANGGTINLGNMPPATAVATYPTGTITQVGPFRITGLTGVAGAIPGAYASFYDTQGPPASGVSYTPTDRILATDLLTTAGESIPSSGGSYAVQAEWLGTILYPSAPPAPSAPTPAVPIAGKFQIQALQYTGDGTASQAILTNANLSVGRVLIWIFPDQTGVGPIFRNNDPSMAGGTALIGSSALSANSGIGSFTAGGFTVIKGVDAPVFSSNENTVKYNAYIFTDTVTPLSQSYLAFGTYTGTGIAQSVGLPFAPTVVWDLNNDGIYRSAPEFGGGDLSVDLSVVNNPQTQMIKSLDVAGFTVGTNVAANANGHTFYFAALKIPVGDAARAFFDTFKFTGIAGAKTITVFTATPSTESLVVAHIIDSSSPAQWRGMSQTGTNSRGMDGTNNATTGITTFGAGTFTVGSAFTAHDFYGWAISGATVTVGGPATGGGAVGTILGGNVIVQGAAGSGIATGDLGAGGPPCGSYS